MTPAHRRSTLGAIIVCFVAVALAACNGSELTPEAYFETLRDETAGYSEAVTELRTQYGEDLSAEIDALREGSDFSDTAAVAAFFREAQEVAIVKTAEMFSRSSTHLRSMLDTLEDITPPPGLEQEHGDLVAAGEALQASMAPTIEAIRNLGSIDDLQTTIDATPYTVALQRFGIACGNMQNAAADGGVAVELVCPPSLAEGQGA